MAQVSGLSEAWMEASAAFPLGWRLEGVTCASTGLAPEQRSDRWRAIAAGPKGEKMQGEGDDAISALIALSRTLVEIRGSMSG
jgi:hypothetical protein